MRCFVFFCALFSAIELFQYFNDYTWSSGDEVKYACIFVCVSLYLPALFSRCGVLWKWSLCLGQVYESGFKRRKWNHLWKPAWLQSWNVLCFFKRSAQHFCTLFFSLAYSFPGLKDQPSIDTKAAIFLFHFNVHVKCPLEACTMEYQYMCKSSGHNKSIFPRGKGLHKWVAGACPNSMFSPTRLPKSSIFHNHKLL